MYELAANNSMESMFLLSETLPMGGTSSFAINICRGMEGSGRWRAIAGVLRDMGEISREMRAEGLPVISPRTRCPLHEDRIEEIYRQCAALAPRVVVAALSPGSFDFLRYVPGGVLRIGMIQSDEEGFYELVERYIPWLDAVAGVSQEICRKMASRLGGRAIPVFHQPYGVPMPAAMPERSHTGRLRVLYLGRVIEEQKRASMMLRIMKSTLAAGIDLEWTIAGDGPALELFREAFSHSDRVRLLGQVEYKDIPKVLACHDVYFLCSDYEGLPLSLLEAMGSGLVPVVSDLPSGISEVLDDANGIRVSVHDEAGFVRALAGLADNRAATAIRSIKARDAVLHSHSTVAMAGRWEVMIESLIRTDVNPHWNPECRATAPLELLDSKWFHPWLRPVRRLAKDLLMSNRLRNARP